MQVPPIEAFQHYACLYIKYMQIFRKLEACYDNMIHPQKRLDVKHVLQAVMGRVMELKLMLVRWNPPNPDLVPPDSKTGAKFPFPWEYVNLDDILVDLKLPPATLEVPVPKYFVEDRINDIRRRDKVPTTLHQHAEYKTASHASVLTAPLVLPPAPLPLAAHPRPHGSWTRSGPHLC